MMSCALCLLVAPDLAYATAAPMCNELAQTIEAPPPVLPSDGGTIRAGEDCAALHMAKTVPGAPHRAQSADFTSPIQFAPTEGVWISRSPRQRWVAPNENDNPALSGFSSGVYRPPR